MKAARMIAHRQALQVQTVPDPTPGPTDAVVRVSACGICRTDWHLWNDDWTWGGLHTPLPFTLGHEMCGVVEAVGADVKTVRVGQRVIVPFHMACGTCAYCIAGRQNLCDRLATMGTDHDGAFAEFVLVPYAWLNCIAIPESVDDMSAAALGCRYMTAYRGVTARGRVRAGEWVAIHGCGGVGLSAVQIAVAHGAMVVAVDIDDEKLAVARRHGAITTVNATHGKVAEAVKGATDGGAHLAVVANGHAEVVVASLMSLRKGGRQVQIGLTSQEEQGQVPVPLDLFIQSELELIGSDGNPHHHYPEMLALVDRGLLKPQQLVTRTVDLAGVDEVLQGFTDYSTRGYEILVP